MFCLKVASWQLSELRDGIFLVRRKNNKNYMKLKLKMCTIKISKLEFRSRFHWHAKAPAGVISNGIATERGKLLEIPNAISSRVKSYKLLSSSNCISGLNVTSLKNSNYWKIKWLFRKLTSLAILIIYEMHSILFIYSV